MVRANAIKDDTLSGFSRRMADVVIEPDVGRVHWADFGSFDSCITKGDEAATAAIGKIREVLRHERLFSIVRPGLRKRLAELHLQHEGMKLCVS